MKISNIQAFSAAALEGMSLWAAACLLGSLLMAPSSSAQNIPSVECRFSSEVGLGLRYHSFPDGTIGLEARNSTTFGQVFVLADPANLQNAVARELGSDTVFGFLCDDSSRLLGFRFADDGIGTEVRSFPSGDFLGGSTITLDQRDIYPLAPLDDRVILTRATATGEAVAAYSATGVRLWESSVDFGRPIDPATLSINPYGPEGGVLVKVLTEDGGQTLAYLDVDGNLVWVRDESLGAGDPPSGFVADAFAPGNLPARFAFGAQVISEAGQAGTHLVVRDALTGARGQQFVWSDFAASITERIPAADGVPWVVLLGSRTSPEASGHKAIVAVNSSSGEVSALDFGIIDGDWFGGEADVGGAAAFFLRNFAVGDQYAILCQLEAEAGLTGARLYRRNEAAIDRFTPNLICETGKAPLVARLTDDPSTIVAGGTSAFASPPSGIEIVLERTALGPGFTEPRVFQPERFDAPSDLVQSQPGAGVTAAPTNTLADSVTALDSPFAGPPVVIADYNVEVTVSGYNNCLAPPKIEVTKVGNNLVLRWVAQESVTDYKIEEVLQVGGTPVPVLNLSEFMVGQTLTVTLPMNGRPAAFYRVVAQVNSI